MVKKSVRVLAIDPGTGQLGWSVLDYDLKTGKVHVVKHGVVKGDQVAKELKKTMLPEFSRQYTVLCAIFEVMCNLIKEYLPDHVACEGPFAHRFIQAYGALKLVVDRVRQATHCVLNRNIYEVQPTEVKLAISGKGGANKDGVKKAVLEHKDLVIKRSKTNPVEDATEHEFDSMAVGYCFIKKLLPSILAEAANLNNAPSAASAKK